MRKLAGAMFLGFNIAIMACVPSPTEVERTFLWSQCLLGASECASALTQTVSIDEASFQTPGIDLRTAQRVREILNTAVHSFAQTPLLPWSFTDQELSKSALKRFFFPPMWREIVRGSETQKKDMRLSAFEWAFRFVGDISYSESENTEFIARYDYFGKRRLGQILLTHKIPREVQTGRALTTGVLATNIFFHEATHGAATVHGFCKSGNDQESCDDTLNGPYGMEILYSLAVVRAELQRPNPDMGSVKALQYYACMHLNKSINQVPKEYTDILPQWWENGCKYDDLATWFLRLDLALNF